MPRPTSTQIVRQVSCATPCGVLVILLGLAAIVGGCAGAPTENRRIELIGELPTQSGRSDRRGLRVVLEIPDRTNRYLPMWGDVQSVGRGYMGLVSILMDVDGKTASLYAPTEDISTWALPSGQLVRSESFKTLIDPLFTRLGGGPLSEFLEGKFSTLRVRAVGEFDSTDWFEVSETRKKELREALAEYSHRRSTK